MAVIAKKNPYRSEDNKLKGDDPTEEKDGLAALLATSDDEEEKTAEELLEEEEEPDPVLWEKATKQAESEGQGDNEKYIKFLYTELEEEAAGVDLDGDGEAGEPEEHKETVLEEPKEKKRKSFFNLMGYGK